MGFSNDVVTQAWKRAGERCECGRVSHPSHGARCGNGLIWENRGREGGGAWEAHHKTAGGPDTVSNCEILCWDCHLRTF